MSERVTILEVHLGDSTIQFGPRMLRGGEGTDDDTTDDDASDTASGGSLVRSIGTVLLVAVGLAVLGVVARKRFGAPDLDSAEELDELVN